MSLLIVDDQPEVRKVVRHIFERDGRFALAEAKDGDEAVRLATSDPPDAVLLDISMPGVSGITTLPKLRESAPSSRIVILSSHSQMENEMVAMGADAFLPKETPAKELVKVVARLMGL